MTERYLNVKQVLELLGISESTLWRLMKSGELHGFKIKSVWRFAQSEIDRYVAEQIEKAAKQPVAS